MRISLLCFLFWPFLIFSQEERIIDEVVAQVGSEIILLSDIEGNLRQMQSYQKNLPPDAYCFILENLLVGKLMVNQAKLDSVEVTDDEVETQMQARMDQIMSALGGDREQFIAYYGKTPEELQEEVREDMRDMLLENKMKEQIVSKIAITPTEVIRFFNAIPKDSLPYYSAEVEVSEIVIKPVANEATKQATHKRLEEIRKRIIAGEDFAKLAQLNSDDESGKEGGNLGWAVRGQYVPEFEAVAFNLEINELSEIVETEFGYHLLQLLDRRGNRINARHILLIPEIGDEDKLVAKSKLDSVRTLILADSITFEEAVSQYSDAKEMSYNNGGRVFNFKTSNTYFEVKDLDPDIYFAIENIKVGDISTPQEYLGQRGDTRYRLLKLMSKTTPHQANLKQDYAKMQSLSKDAKRNDFLNTWIKGKIDDTFMVIDRAYRTCPNLAVWKNKE